MNENNKISIFASNATDSHTEQHSGSTGYCYFDDDWMTSTDRQSGAKEGLAYSINYNTAIRQATFMSSVLAEVICARNAESQAYSDMSTYGIGTNRPQAETLDNHAVNIAAVLNKDNFLMAGEVTTPKIFSKAVTTDKINDYSVNSLQLGNILADNPADNASIEQTTNGLTIRISQADKHGKLNLTFTGNTVTNSDKVKVNSSSSGTIYLLGSTATSGYNTPGTNNDLRYQMGSSNILYSPNVVASGYIQANYFNATSDARLKQNIENINPVDVKDIIETTHVKMFEYKEEPGRKCIGVIAQDLADKVINNNFICVDQKDGYYVVKESKLVYLLWDYVQQLNERIKQLESK